MEETRHTWSIKGIWTVVKNSLMAILMGEFLLRLNIGRYFVHIVYTFFLFALVIWISLSIDTTLTKVEDGRERIHELEIIWSDKVFKEAEASGRSTVEKRLKQLGSEVGEPERPATIIEIK